MSFVYHGMLSVPVKCWKWLVRSDYWDDISSLARQLGQGQEEVGQPQEEKQSAEDSQPSSSGPPRKQPRITSVARRTAVPRPPSPLPSDNPFGVHLSLMSFFRPFVDVSSQFLNRMPAAKLCPLGEYGSLAQRLSYVWCQWKENNCASLVPLIGNNRLTNVITARCHMYYVFDKGEYCMVHVSMVVDPNRAFDLLRLIMSESLSLGGVLAEDPALDNSSHHHYPVTYTQLLDYQREVVRTIKVRDRGEFLRGRDVDIEWTTPVTYKRLYKHNLSTQVPKSVEEIRLRMKRADHRESALESSDLERLTRMELAYLRRERAATLRTLADIDEREQRLVGEAAGGTSLL